MSRREYQIKKLLDMRLVNRWHSSKRTQRRFNLHFNQILFNTHLMNSSNMAAMRLPEEGLRVCVWGGVGCQRDLCFGRM